MVVAVVRRQHYSHAGGAQLRDELPHCLPGLRIEPRCRLIKEHDLRAMHHTTTIINRRLIVEM